MEKTARQQALSWASSKYSNADIQFP